MLQKFVLISPFLLLKIRLTNIPKLPLPYNLVRKQKSIVAQRN